MLMDLNFGLKCACGWASHPWNKSKYSLQVLLGKSTEKILNEMLLLLKVATRLSTYWVLIYTTEMPFFDRKPG